MITIIQAPTTFWSYLDVHPAAAFLGGFAILGMFVIVGICVYDLGMASTNRRKG